jgi:hypothetical protein
VTITPNDNGLPGISELETIVGALLTVDPIASVTGLVLSAIVWAVGTVAAIASVVAVHKRFALQAARSLAEAGLGPDGWLERQVVSALVLKQAFPGLGRWSSVLRGGVRGRDGRGASTGKPSL